MSSAEKHKADQCSRSIFKVTRKLIFLQVHQSINYFAIILSRPFNKGNSGKISINMVIVRMRVTHHADFEFKKTQIVCTSGVPL